MSPEFARLVTFEGHEDILRASPLNTVMRHAGAIYKNADGSAETYKLSEPVSVIDTFVSHNWSVSRYKKFVALALHFNFYIAAAVTTLYCIVLMILGYFNVIPCVITYQGETIAIVGSVTCAPVFLITFYCCRDVLWACGMPTRAVFLDKTCIHQTDKGLQQVGIQKLGAFLHRSRHMLVLHSNVYWVKLWTVYEIAAFLSLHRVERMTVLPVQQAVFFALCVPLCTVWQYSATVLWFLGFGLGAYFCLGIILAFVHIVVHRLWARERQASFNTVSNFTVQNCQCCCEADRPVVYDNIRTLMIGCGVVSADSEEDVALAAFDELVRSRMIHRVVAGPLDHEGLRCDRVHERGLLCDRRGPDGQLRAADARWRGEHGVLRSVDVRLLASALLARRARCEDQAASSGLARESVGPRHRLLWRCRACSCTSLWPEWDQVRRMVTRRRLGDDGAAAHPRLDLAFCRLSFRSHATCGRPG